MYPPQGRRWGGVRRPPGLSYYYFLSLLITIVQTYIFRACVNEDKMRARMMANATGSRGYRTRVW